MGATPSRKSSSATTMPAAATTCMNSMLKESLIAFYKAEHNMGSIESGLSDGGQQGKVSRRPRSIANGQEHSGKPGTSGRLHPRCRAARRELRADARKYACHGGGCSASP